MIPRVFLLFFVAGLLLSAVEAEPTRETKPALSSKSHKAPTVAKPIKVGVAGPSPYVTGSERLDGFSVKVWQGLADDQDLDYELVAFGSLRDLRRALLANQIDVAVGPIPINSETAREVSLTQPYHRSRVALVTPDTQRELTAILASVLSLQTLALAAALVGTLLLVAWVVWVLERKQNATQFPPNNEGFLNSVWFAIVTMTTVGYGDHHPVTRGGRVVTAAWMLSATAVFSALVAVVATRITLAESDINRISSLADLGGRRLGVISGTTGSEIARYTETKIAIYQTMDEAFTAMKMGTLDAVMGDEVELQYTMAVRGETDLRLVELVGREEVFGFAVRPQSPLEHQLDLAVIDLRESGELRSIRESWLASVARAPRSTH